MIKSYVGVHGGGFIIAAAFTGVVAAAGFVSLAVYILTRL